MTREQTHAQFETAGTSANMNRYQERDTGLTMLQGPNHLQDHVPKPGRKASHAGIPAPEVLK